MIENLNNPIKSITMERLRCIILDDDAQIKLDHPESEFKSYIKRKTKSQ
jgi:hypothetical protein